MINTQSVPDVRLCTTRWCSATGGGAAGAGQEGVAGEGAGAVPVSAAPHWRQNLLSSGFAVPQRGHVIL
jgi:hypothetical protein